MERVWDEWVRNEFVHTMRAKGKWEAPKTLASEAKRRELSGSTRIFSSEEDNPAMKPKPQKKEHKKRHPKERHAIKLCLLSVMKEIENEKRVNEELTNEYRESLLENLKTMNKELDVEAS